MTSVIRLGLVLLAVAGTGCLSSMSPWMRNAVPGPPPGPDECKVVFYRSWRIPESKHFPLYDGETLIGFSEMKAHIEYRCRPGRHVFLSWGENDRFLDADLAAGNTYFVECVGTLGFWSAHVDLHPADPASEGFAGLEELLKDFTCRELDPDQALHTGAFMENRKTRVADMLRKLDEKRAIGVRVLKPEQGKRAAP